MSKVYIASSWKNKDLLSVVDSALKLEGFEVSNFSHPDDRDSVFNWGDILGSNTMNIIDVLQVPAVIESFKEDKKWLDWSDWVLLVLPSGKSSHLEAGYAVGAGKKLAIYAKKFPVGEFDTMYGFADVIGSELTEVMQLMKHRDEKGATLMGGDQS